VDRSNNFCKPLRAILASNACAQPVRIIEGAPRTLSGRKGGGGLDVGALVQAAEAGHIRRQVGFEEAHRDAEYG
jgi:hypothetical protein